MINDIFKKSNSTNENKKTEIIIDSREKNSLVPAELIGLGHTIILKQIKVGDYIANNTIIERKEIKDLFLSIQNKRIWKQLEEIKQYPNYILIIEGDIYTQKIHPNIFRGFILSVATKFKIPIIFTKHPKETAQYISILANKKEKNEILTPTKKQFTKQSIQINILQTFPKIGQKTAIKLLKEFKTIKNTINASEEKLKTTLGKKTNEFIKTIN